MKRSRPHNDDGTVTKLLVAGGRAAVRSIEEGHDGATGKVTGTKDRNVNFSAPFIRRPIATTLLSIAVILAGIAGYASLAVSSLPQVEFAAISVSASLPGADPETMASAIATPLERQFSRIAGINEMTSVSSTGNVSIALQFDLDRDIDGAARDVEAAINAARGQLPSNMPQNPSYRRVNPGESASITIALTSDTMTRAQLYDQADSILAQKIAQVNGVGQVSVSGSAKPAVRIEANPMLLAHAGLGLEALRFVISSVNVNKPKGYLSDGVTRYSIGATDQLFDAAAYAPLSVSTSASQPGVTRIEDVAQVVDSVEDINTTGSFNGKPAILINVTKAPGANVIQMVDKVRALLPTLQASVPPAVKLDVALDRTVAIRESVHDVTRTLIIAILLVIVVVFVFLREVGSTLIPSVSVPLSLFGTFAVMYLLGYTLDNLSLMALTISTGFVVDDAIVVMENIVRHLEDGMTPWEAALYGSKEIGFTVVSMSVSLIAVFIPILLMQGIVGRLFREFAITLSVSILVSLLVSLTTTPMLSAQFLKSRDGNERGWLYRVGERCLNWLIHEYEMGLQWVLCHQKFTLLVTGLTIVLNFYLYTIVPKGFFPEMDSGRLIGQIRGQQDVSFDTLVKKSDALVEILRKIPGIQNVMMSIGGGGGGSSIIANLNVFLSPADERAKNGDTAPAILERVRKLTGGFPGASLALQSSQELRIGARTAASLYQYSLTSDNLAELNEWAPKLMAAMQRIPIIKDITTDQQDKGLRAQLVIDRQTAARLGVSTLAIDNTLADAFGQRQVATMYMPVNQYHVVMEVAPEFRNNPDSLQHIFVKSSTGTMVPLSALTRFEERRMPLAVNHQSQSPAATLSFNLAEGASLSDATAAIEQTRLSIGMPSDIHGGFQGTALAFKESLANQPELILLALITVYIVLGILYENLIHPLTILSTLPSAGVGAILALLLFKTELSVIAMIGIILLIGIVKKNAIMMVDFALQAERQSGKTPLEAIREACLLRFRPIMMTTMAALFGGIPLALGTGPGSELRRPLGITIIGGLIVSQLMTLFTTPVVYLAFDRLRRRLQNAVAREVLRGKAGGGDALTVIPS
ncbi:MAG TPA: efflux RND transporter permease subunit [Terracidiphilus sp.]|nr:efflux RND transporter permease subunit [Terracidiphilus sp.]